MLRRNGRTVLVQCKQWRRRQIPVTVVRELWGLAQHHQADGVVLACIGTYTADASAFAAGKPIELVNGNALLEMIRGVQATPRATTPSTDPMHDAASSNAVGPRLAPDVGNETASLPCPVCAAPMVQRINRRTGQPFHGCSAYPTCRGTRAL
jgi:restriction system protein